MHPTSTTAPPDRAMRAPQWLSLFAGLIVTGATVAILAGDAISTGKWGQDQWLGLVILTATISFGLLGKRAATDRSWLASAAFYVMFGIGSVLLVYSSMGRQAGTRAELVNDARNVNGAIAALEAEKTRAEETIAGLQAELARFAGVRSTAEIKGALDAVVGSGPGKVPVAVWRRTSSCAATETTREDSARACQPVFDLRIENGKALEREQLQGRLDNAEAARQAIVARIAASGGRKVAPGKARPFAEVAGLLGYDAAHVEYVMSRIDILLVTLFLEGSAIVAFEYAFAGIFGSRLQMPTEHPARGHTSVGPSVAHSRNRAGHPDGPTPPRGPKRRRRSRRQPQDGGPVAIPENHPVIVALKDARRPLTNDELARAMHVTKGEASKRRREVAGQLTVSREGRELRIALGS